MDPHRNLYFYYSGQERRDTDRARQIEDNSTKAMVNTMELSERWDGPHALVKPFLEWLGIDWVEGRVKFALQRATLSETTLTKAKRKVLLGIAPYRPSEVEAKPDSKEGSRPDAWIWGEGFVVCIETKTVGTFDEGQLKRHMKTLGRGSERRIHTWREVYEVMAAQLRRLEKKERSPTRALLAELVGYLDIIAYQQGIPMGTFTGFKREHFDAFVRLDPEDNEDNRRRVKHYLALFAEALRERPPRVLEPFDKVTVGNIKELDRYAWATLSRLDQPVHEPHFSFAIGPDAFTVMLLMEGKKPTTAALRAVEADPDRFYRALKRLVGKEPTGFSLVLMRRRQVRVRLYRAEPVLEFHLAHVHAPDIDYLISKMREIRADTSESSHGGLFELHIKRTYYRDDPAVASAKFAGSVSQVLVGLAELDSILK